MADPKRDEAAVEAIARAMYKGWPARIVGKAAPGWAQVLLVALRTDPSGRDAVVGALLDETMLVGALRRAGLPDEADAERVAHEVLNGLTAESVSQSELR